MRIDNPGDSYFVEDALIPYKEFETEREKILQRGGRPPSLKIRVEKPAGNGNGDKELPATVQGEPIPDKYRELTPFIDEPLPPGTDFLVPAVAVVTEEGERKIDAVLRQLKDGVEGIQDSTQFRLFLTTMSKFHDYSIGNLILIAMQKPTATRVAGFVTWKDLGRWVKAGERGIAILAPVLPPKPKKEEREDEEEEVPLTPVYFKVVHVFDISQTDGKPLPEFEVPVLTGEANEELFAKVLALAKAQGLEVSYESRPHQDPGIKGQYSGKSIWVKSDEPKAQQLKSLLHELAHYYSEGVFRIPRRDAETIAESAAFAVGAHFGFDSGTRSFSYVALWAQDKKVLQANLASIRKVTTVMLEGLESTGLKLTQTKVEVVKPIWKQYKEGEQRPSRPSARPRWGYSESEVIDIEPVERSTHDIRGGLLYKKQAKQVEITPSGKPLFLNYIPMAREKRKIGVFSKGQYPEYESYLDGILNQWALRMGIQVPQYILVDDDAFFYTTEKQIAIPIITMMLHKTKAEGAENLIYWVAHEFAHYVVDIKQLNFESSLDEEDYANRLAEYLSGIRMPDAITSLHELSKKLWVKAVGNKTLEQVLGEIPKDAKDRGLNEKWLPALKPFEPYHFAEFVLRFNRFSDAEIPIYSGLTGRNPLRVPDHIWREVVEGTEGDFVKQGDLNVFHIPEKERPNYMRAAPTWRDIASTLPSPKDELEFVSDSPEFLAYTIEDIGYRDKLDTAFETAIAKAKEE